MLRDDKGTPATVPGVGGAGGEPDREANAQAPTGAMAQSVPTAERATGDPRGGRPSQNRPQEPVTTAEDLFHETIQHSGDWLREICCDLGSFDLRDGLHAMRAVFGVLREHLPVEEGAHLAAQLPVLVRGLYYDGWRPTFHQRARSHEEFVARVRDNLLGQRPVDPQRACEAVFGALSRHVTRGELEDVRACLPGVLKDLVAAPA
ncbi:MAG: DUF2267 domain-containing protein [Myxococcota bacterium]